MGANERQIGGSHYKLEGGEEHWDRMWRMHGRGYFVGCITKYVERYHKKNGVQDLEKAKHFIEKLIELEGGTVVMAELTITSTLEETPSRHPHAEQMGSEVMATGWVGYTFEGADAAGFLFTCSNCRAAFRAEPNRNPNDYHTCPISE